MSTDSPYLGLSSFSEDQHDLFHGREDETAELLQLVERETLTTVFGVSGLGKSSLLRAGLFPALRAAQLFPIAIRLAFDAGAGGLVEQIRRAVAAEIAVHHVDAAPPGDDPSLWEYFHRTPFWDARNRLLVPVLVLDQFEELFTLGAGHAGIEDLLVELADLVENRIPDRVRASHEAEALPPSFERPKAKVVLSLREDYLARLEDLRPRMASLVRSRFRVRAMTGAQAVGAVFHARSEHLIDREVAEKVVRFVAGAPAEARELGEVTIEPALLSLVCRELDERRQQRGEAMISAALLDNATARILDDFYDRSIADLAPGIGKYVEEHLLTSEGHRTTVARAEVRRALGTTESIDQLVDRRILRVEDRLGQPHVEVIHDVLCRVMIARRDARREAADQAAATAARRRRARRRRNAAIAALLAVAAGVGWIVYRRARADLAAKQAKQEAEAHQHVVEQTTTSVDTLLDEGLAALGAAQPWSAARLLAVAYSTAAHVIPHPAALDMVVHRMTGLVDHFRKTLRGRHSAPTVLAFSPSGDELLSVADGAALIWTLDGDAAPASFDEATGERALRPASPTSPPGLGNRPATSGVRDAAAAAAPASGQVASQGAATSRTAKPGAAAASTADTTSDSATSMVETTSIGLAAIAWEKHRLLTSSDHAIVLWDIGTQKPIDAMRVDDEIAGIALSGDGSWCAALTRSGFRIWHLEAGGAGASGADAKLALIEWKAASGSDDNTGGTGGTEELLRRRMLFEQQERQVETAPSPAEREAAYERLQALEDDQAREGSTAIAFDVGQHVAISRNGATEIWDLGQGQAVPAKLPEASELWWSSDGKHLAARGVDGISVYSAGDWKVERGWPRVADHVQFDDDPPQGEVVVSRDEVDVVATSGQVAWSFRQPCSEISAVDLRGGRLAYASPCGITHLFVPGKDGTTDAANDLVLDGQAIAVNARRGLAAVGSHDGTIRIWSLDRGGTDQTLVGENIPVPTASLVALGVGPTPASDLAVVGTRIFAGHNTSAEPGRDEGEVLGVFDLTAGAIAKAASRDRFDHPSTDNRHGTYMVSPSADGSTFVSVGTDERARLWSVRDDKWSLVVPPLGSDQRPVRGAVLSPDGHVTVTSSKTGITGALCVYADGLQRSCDDVPVAWDRLAMSPDGKTVAGSDRQGDVFVWSIAGHPPDRPLATLNGAIEDVVFDPSGTRVAAISQGGDAGAWEVASGARVAALSRHLTFAAVAFGGPAHDLLIVRTQGIGTALVLKIGTHDPPAELALVGSVGGLDVSRDGGSLLACGDGYVERWDLSRLARTAAIHLADDRVAWCAARFVGDGRVVTLQSDGVLSTWSPAQLDASSAGDDSVTHVAFSRDDARITSFDGFATDVWTASGAFRGTVAGSVPPAQGNGATLTASRGRLAAIAGDGSTALGPALVERRWAPMVATDGTQAIAVDDDLRYRTFRADDLAHPVEGVLATSGRTQAISAIDFFDDGRLLATTVGGDTSIYDADGHLAKHGPRLSRGGGRIVRGNGGGLAAFGNDDVATFATADDGGTVVRAHSRLIDHAAAWDRKTGALLLGEVDDDRLVAHGTTAWSHLAFGPGLDYYIPQIVKFSSDGARAVIASSHAIEVISSTDGHSLRLHALDQGDDSAIDAWFLDDDTVLVRTSKHASTWHLKTNRLDPLEIDTVVLGPKNQLAFAAGATLATAHYEHGQLKMDRVMPGCADAAFTAITWSPDGRWIAAAHDVPSNDPRRAICTWNLATDTVQEVPAHRARVTDLTFRADGERLLSLSADGTAQLWSLGPHGELSAVATIGHEYAVAAGVVAGVPRVVTGDSSGAIRSYDVGSAAAPVVLQAEDDATLRSARIDEASGRVLTVDDRGRVALWDPAAPEHARRLSLLDGGSGHAVTAVLARGGRLFAVTIDNGTKLWTDATSPKAVELSTLSATAMAFSDDGAWIATTSDEGTATIWRTSDGTFVLRLDAGVPLKSVAWSHDRTRLVVGGLHGFVKTFDLSLETRDADVVTRLVQSLSPHADQHAGS